MTEHERRTRQQRRRQLLEELEQLRRLRSSVAPFRWRRLRREQVQRMTRLLG